MSAVLDEEEEETEEQRYQRFFGPAESSTEDDESDEEEAPPAPRLAIESEASALLAKLIGEVLSEAKTRPERETARLACAAAGSFLAQIPGAAGAFESEASREDVLAEGPSATLCVARGARFTALDDVIDGALAPPPVDAGATWACLVGRPWPMPSERPARARRYVLAVRRGVVVRATQTSSGALARPDASRHLLALCRCVDALGRCGVDTSAARVHAWVDDAMSGTREAPVAHLVAVEPLGHADDDALAAALGAGPELVYRAVEAE
jgi:hypothetical protein